jgi:hypothetical protein
MIAVVEKLAGRIKISTAKTGSHNVRSYDLKVIS